MRELDSKDFKNDIDQAEDFLDDMDFQDEPVYEEDEFTLDLGEDFEAIVDDVMKEQSESNEDRGKSETKVDKVLSMLLQVGGLAIGALSVALTVIVWNGVHGGNTDIRVNPSSRETTTESTTRMEQNILDGDGEVSTFMMEFISSAQEAGSSYQWYVNTEDETTTPASTTEDKTEPPTTEPVSDEPEETTPEETTKKPKPTKEDTTKQTQEETPPPTSEEETTPAPTPEETTPAPTPEETTPAPTPEETTPASVAAE